MNRMLTTPPDGYLFLSAGGIRYQQLIGNDWISGADQSEETQSEQTWFI